MVNDRVNGMVYSNVNIGEGNKPSRNPATSTLTEQSSLLLGIGYI